MASPASGDGSKDVDTFLSSCAASGEAAYAAAEAVLDRLQARASRAAARRLLGAVRRRFASGQEHCFHTFHFRDVVVEPHLQAPLQQSVRGGMGSAVFFWLEQQRWKGHAEEQPWLGAWARLSFGYHLTLSCACLFHSCC